MFLSSSGHEGSSYLVLINQVLHQIKIFFTGMMEGCSTILISAHWIALFLCDQILHYIQTSYLQELQCAVECSYCHLGMKGLLHTHQSSTLPHQNELFHRHDGGAFLLSFGHEGAGYLILINLVLHHIKITFFTCMMKGVLISAHWNALFLCNQMLMDNYSMISWS